MALDPDFNANANSNLADDNWLPQGEVDSAYFPTPIGLVIQQLKIITVILRQAFNITDEDISLLTQTPQTLNPPLPPSI